MNKKINNNRLFILFSFLVFLIILVFVYALYKTLSYEFPDYSKSKIFRIVKSYKDLIKSKLGYSKRK